MPREFDRGMLAGVLVMLAAHAGNALITPPANAGGTLMYLLAAQLILCLGAALWIARRYRSRRHAAA